MRISDWSSDVCSSDLFAPPSFLSALLGGCGTLASLASPEEPPVSGVAESLPAVESSCFQAALPLSEPCPLSAPWPLSPPVSLLPPALLELLWASSLLPFPWSPYAGVATPRTNTTMMSAAPLLHGRARQIGRASGGDRVCRDG